MAKFLDQIPWLQQLRKINVFVPLKLRLYLPMMAIVIAVVSLTTIWFVYISIRSFNNQLRNSLELEVQAISKMFERESVLKQEKVRTSLKVVSKMFFDSQITALPESIVLQATNQETQKVQRFEMPFWERNDQQLFMDTSFVDQMEGLLGGYITIFQKFEQGFVRVSTNIRRKDGSRAMATYIPNSSVIAQTVMRGETYFGRAFVIDEYYTTAYTPIFLNNKVEGMLFVGEREKDMEDLKKIISKFKIGKSGYAFVFDSDGILLVHPRREGQIWADPKTLDKVSENKKGVVKLHGHTVAYQYFEQFELYIAASIVKKIENQSVVRSVVAGSTFVALFAILALLFFVIRFATEKFYVYLNALEKSEVKLATAEEALRQTEKLAHMGQVSAGIAHELNNPLGVITMYSNIVLDELPPGDPLREDMNLIVEQATRCKNIVGGLLNFARKNKLKLSDVNINDFVARSLESVVVPPHVKTEIKGKLENPMVMLDYNQMMQVFTNLEKNAIEAMPNGGNLVVELSGDAVRVNIVISDTGTGISEENMDKLFTPFFTTKELGKGTGLGLSLVYGIVKMHKGKIEVKSNNNPEKGPTGTSFHISIPRVF